MRSSWRQRSRSFWLALGFTALLVGCTKHADDAAQSLPPCARGGKVPVDRCLSAGDAQFTRRAEPGLLDAAIGTYLDALSLNREDPRVLARLARAYATRAYANPDTAAQDDATARSMGLRCLLTDPDLQATVTAAGGLLTNRGISALPFAMAPCALWTALAWARSLAAAGVAGAAIDLRTVQLLAERAVALDPAQERGLGEAVLGLVLALPPQPLHPDLDGAERHLRASIASAPGRLTPAVDLAEWVLARRGDAVAWKTTLEQIANTPLEPTDPDLLENRRAVERAKTALAAGPVDPAAWWRP